MRLKVLNYIFESL